MNGENVGQTTNNVVLNEVISKFAENFGFIPEFKYIKKDKSERDIFIYKIDETNIGVFGRMIQNAKIVLKVKRYQKEEKWLQNFDFSYEFFGFNNQRQGFSSVYFVYDEERNSYREYKN
jgi:hypothetical protein